MPLTGIADSDQLRMLTDVLDQYCLEHDIPDPSEERARASRTIYTLFENGLQTPGEIKGALEVLSRAVCRRPGYFRSNVR
jgi:hypothetical protein